MVSVPVPHSPQDATPLLPTMSEWHAYCAGFFDGEGSVTIARLRTNGNSDYHLVRVVINQRVKYRVVLDRIATDFGGHVHVRSQKTRVSRTWAEQADWVLQHKPSILRFLTAVQPYCIVKAEQVAVGLEFLATFVGGKSFRDDLGRIHGRLLTADEIERRERLRLKLRELNANGPPKVAPSQLPPLDVQVRRRAEAEAIGDRTSVLRGEQIRQSKLNVTIVRQMRLDHAAGIATIQGLATQYGVSYMTVYKAITRQTWNHVDPQDLPVLGQLSLPQRPE